MGRKLPLYYGGGGAAFVVNDDLALAAQVKAGLNYFFEGPFDAFFELIPVLFLTPNVSPGIGVALGGRYYW